MQKLLSRYWETEDGKNKINIKGMIELLRFMPGMRYLIFLPVRFWHCYMVINCEISMLKQNKILRI